MIPLIAAGIAGLASFIGISLVEKNVVKAPAAPPKQLPPAGQTPQAPQGDLPVMPSFDLPEQRPGLPPVIPPAPAPPRPAPFSTQPLSPFLQAKPDGTTTVAFNPDGTPHDFGTPFVAANNADAKSIVQVANELHLSVFEVELLRSGTGKLAVVTTNDPSPSGDLIIRTQPNPSAPQIDGGGADKGATVTIIRDVDATWSEVFWRGGNRPLGQGFARRQFLRVIPNPTLV